MIYINDNEKKELVKAGLITKEQNLEMTINRHLRWITKAKIKDPSSSIKILCLLHVNEGQICDAIKAGQYKILKDLDIVFEETTGHPLLCLQ